MKRKIITTITLILCLRLTVSTLVACNNNADKASSGAKEEVYAPGGEPQSFKATDITLINNGVSEYKIIIPETANRVIVHAAEELQLFLKESTGCELPIETDLGLTNDNTQKYLSVGKTTMLLGQSDIILDRNELGDGGTTIYRKGNTVYIAGPGDYGTLYSVYRFLFYTINFVAYAPGCITYNYSTQLQVLDFDYKWKPTYVHVDGSEEAMGNQSGYSAEDVYRMYHAYSGTSGTESLTGELWSGQYCHTVWYWVSKDLYPELYENGDQLCYSNPRSLELCVESAINKMCKAPSGPYIMIGGLDHAGYCKCAECERQSALYGGQGGLYVRFLNAVAKAVEEYYVENNMSTELTIVGLMYYAYSFAPVTDNGDGTYSVIPVDANDPKVLYPSNMCDEEGQVRVGSCYVTIDSCFTHPLNDTHCETNVYECNKIRGWGAVGSSVNVYDYGVNLSAFTYHFNTWSHSAGTFEFLHQFNGGMYNEESQHENGINSFHLFRAFLRAQHSRNPYQSTEKLLHDFCVNYFGPGSEELEQYFYEIMENYEKIYIIQESEHFGIFTALKTSGYWTRDNLVNYKQLLQKAMYDCERSGLDDAEIYKERIYQEYLLVLINENEAFSAYYSPEEKALIQEEIAIGREKYDVYR